MQLLFLKFENEVLGSGLQFLSASYSFKILFLLAAQLILNWKSSHVNLKKNG